MSITGSISTPALSYEATRNDRIGVTFAAGCWPRREPSQPADSHSSGMENSDQPQSMQTQISGAGVMGG
jgi:hypothetical protein